ncbi:MAG: RteC domain-containing protein [Reichenbachiella sp.]
MYTYVTLLEELEQGTKAIDQMETSTINKCSEKITLTQLIAGKLRELYFSCDLETDASQINFFKEIKPKILSELHYYMELFTYLKERPKGSVKAKKIHIDYAMDKASSFINRHCEFNHYIQLESTHLDTVYFTKRDYDPKLHAHLEYPADTTFSSPGDPTLSCLLAANRYVQFLKNELFTLKNPKLDTTWGNMKHLRWQRSKTDLVELIYSLHTAGAVNGDLKDVVETMERVFDIDIGNFYRIYADIKLKKHPSSFVTILKDSLLEKMKKENE